MNPVFQSIMRGSRFLAVACVALLVAALTGGCGAGGTNYIGRTATSTTTQGTGTVRVSLVVNLPAATASVKEVPKKAGEYSFRVSILQGGVNVVQPQIVAVPGLGVPVNLVFNNVPAGSSVLRVELLDPQGNVLQTQDQQFTTQPQTNLSLEVAFVITVITVTPNPAFADAAPIQPQFKTIRAANPSVGTQVSFQASGGTAPYTWSITTNNSGGTIDANGVYTAGVTGNVDDVVMATDANGSTGLATVHVYPPLAITPVYMQTFDPVNFTISGGSGVGYTITVDNPTLGTLTYTPGATTGTWTPTDFGTATLTVTDSLGGTATLVVEMPPT